MALTELWKNNPNELQEKHVQQVITFAGEGKLRDGGDASKQFRDLLAIIPSSFLERYAGDCLKDAFDGNGFALQDVVNQAGKRLGFQVEQGRYRGVQGENGFDGLWHAPDGHSIVVEVKKTDTYQIVLDKIAVYRRRLIQEGRISDAKSSVLIVVGPSDTNELEAQVRGSRHAWDVRLISIDALLRLMRLKEDLDDPKSLEKIRRVLTPQEFTKVDGIIDLVFSAAEEVKIGEGITEEEDEEEEAKDGSKKPKFVPTNFRDAVAARVQEHLGQPLVKVSSATYSSPDEKTVAICINSREYRKGAFSGFWFAFHPHQKVILEAGAKSFVALGCGSKDFILLIPASDFLPWLERCHKTVMNDRFYWHIRVEREEAKKSYLLHVRKGSQAVALTKYLLQP